MHYAVINNGRVQHLGENREVALKIFESIPGSTLERLEKIEDFITLLTRSTVTPQHKDDDDNDDDYGGYSFDEEVNEILNAIRKQFGGLSETIWSHLTAYGVTKEKVSEVWGQVQQGTKQVAADAELGGKQGLAAFGDMLVRIGNSLVNQSKK